MLFRAVITCVDGRVCFHLEPRVDGFISFSLFHFWLVGMSNISPALSASLDGETVPFPRSSSTLTPSPRFQYETVQIYRLTKNLTLYQDFVPNALKFLTRI